jgi:hypothetical protein
MLWSCFVILGAFYFTRALIDYVKPLSKDHNMYNSADVANDGVGWILSMAFFVDSWLVGLSLQRMADCTVRLGIKARAVLMTSVYRKTFKLANAHGDQNNIVALVATDCQKVYNGCQALHNVWTAPIETAAIIALLLWLTGKFGLPALGVIIFILPLQYYFGYLITQYKLENVKISEARVTRMHEILLAIKLVKFYVWEKSFAAQVAEVMTHTPHAADNEYSPASRSVQGSGAYCRRARAGPQAGAAAHCKGSDDQGPQPLPGVCDPPGDCHRDLLHVRLCQGPHGCRNRLHGPVPLQHAALPPGGTPQGAARVHR